MGVPRTRTDSTCHDKSYPANRALTRLVGPNKDQLLYVTTSMYDYETQIRLLPTAELREDEQHSIAAAQAAPCLTLARAPFKFVVRDLENDVAGRRQELLMAARFQGLLSVRLDESVNDADVAPTTLLQPPEFGVESVRDVQLLE
jgi:hypothetical protein